MEKGDALLASVHYPSIRDKMNRLKKDYAGLCNTAMVRTSAQMTIVMINNQSDIGKGNVTQEHYGYGLLHRLFVISKICVCGPGPYGKSGRPGEGTGSLPQRAPGSGALAAPDVQQDGDS